MVGTKLEPSHLLIESSDNELTTKVIIICGVCLWEVSMCIILLGFDMEASGVVGYDCYHVCSWL